MLSCDGRIMEAGTSVLEALDFWFKFIWVYDLKYHPGLSSFFQFLRYAIYNVSNRMGNESTTGYRACVELKKMLDL